LGPFVASVTAVCPNGAGTGAYFATVLLRRPDPNAAPRDFRERALGIGWKVMQLMVPWRRRIEECERMYT